MTRPPPLTAVTYGPDETLRLAAACAPVVRAGDVLALVGTLGAGKTCFVKGLAAGLGVDDLRQVISPTFVLLRRYDGRIRLHHFDAYRLSGPDEMAAIGCDDIFAERAVSVVEWADHVAACLPRAHLRLDITVTAETERRFELSASVPGLDARLDEFRLALVSWLG